MMPASNGNGYYFPFNPSIRGFDISTYNSEFSDNLISLDQVKAWVGSINQLERVNPNYNTTLCCCLLPVILMGLGAGFLVFYKTGMIWPMSVFPMLSLIPFSFVACLSCKLQQKYIQKRKEEVRILNDFHEKKTFGNVNCRCRSSLHGSYLSLEFTWKNQVLNNNTQNGTIGDILQRLFSTLENMRTGGGGGGNIQNTLNIPVNNQNLPFHLQQNSRPPMTDLQLEDLRARSKDVLNNLNANQENQPNPVLASNSYPAEPPANPFEILAQPQQVDIQPSPRQGQSAGTEIRPFQPDIAETNLDLPPGFTNL